MESRQSEDPAASVCEKIQNRCRRTLIQSVKHSEDILDLPNITSPIYHETRSHPLYITFTSPIYHVFTFTPPISRSHPYIISTSPISRSHPLYHETRSHPIYHESRIRALSHPLYHESRSHPLYITNTLPLHYTHGMEQTFVYRCNVLLLFFR